MNELTKRLYADGWTRDNHPDNVYCSDYENLGYKWEHLREMVWETPCGLLAEAYDISGGDASFNGIDYSAENNNPLVRCPYDNQSCQHIPAEFPFSECPCRMTEKPYDYEKSIKKINDDNAVKAHEKWMEMSGGSYCACIVGANGFKGGYHQIKYDVDKCIAYACKNETCVVTKAVRDLSPVNIFYDIRRTWNTRRGLLDEIRTTIEKGVKVFPKGVARTDAEIWLKTKKANYNPVHDKHIIQPKQTAEDRRQEYFSKHHRLYTPEYSYFEFHYIVENIRIDKSEGRDLLQDLRDVSEGIEVFHSSDVIKSQKNAKKERRQKYQEQKQRRSQKKAVAKLQLILNDEQEPDKMKTFAEKELKRRGIDTSQKAEQINMFEEDKP